MKLKGIIAIVTMVLLVFTQVQFKKTPQTKQEVMSLATGSIFQGKSLLSEHLSFINHDDQLISRETFLGHWSLFFFGYSECPEFCPTILAAMDSVGRNFRGDDLKLYFVSIDPESDTPAQLKDFLTRYKSPIIGLNGSYEQISELALQFKLTVEQAQGKEQHIEHSASLVLVDPKGYPVGLFSDYKNPRQIAKDIQYAQYYLGKN